MYPITPVDNSASAPRMWTDSTSTPNGWHIPGPSSNYPQTSNWNTYNQYQEHSVSSMPPNQQHQPVSLYPSLGFVEPSAQSEVRQEFHSRPASTVPQNVSVAKPSVLDIYTSPEQVRIFFIQKEGHVTAPNGGRMLKAYRGVGNQVTDTRRGSTHRNSFEADFIIEVKDVWKLALRKPYSFCCKSARATEYIFYDNSTTPARSVVVQFPESLSKAEIQRLNVLFTSASNFIIEPTTSVSKIESGLENVRSTRWKTTFYAALVTDQVYILVFTSITSSVNTFVKDKTPDVHKKTHWLRKGTSSIVKTGGKFMSQGAHLVTDPILDKSPPKDTAPEHIQLLSDLEVYRKALNNSSVTYLK